MTNKTARTVLDVGALPDRSQLFRMLREAGRSDKAKAEAIEAHLLYLAEYHGRTEKAHETTSPLPG